SKDEGCDGKLVEPAVDGVNSDSIGALKRGLERLLNAGAIERDAAAVVDNELAVLIEESKEVASADVPELGASVLDRAGIVGCHERLEAGEIGDKGGFV